LAQNELHFPKNRGEFDVHMKMRNGKFSQEVKDRAAFHREAPAAENRASQETTAASWCV